MLSARSSTRIRQTLAAILLYALLGILYFGIGVVNHLTTHHVGALNGPAHFTWMLHWWSLALEDSSIDVLFSHYLWQPVGISIANTASIPLLATFMAIPTKFLGAQCSYNLLAIFLPSCSAWSAYFLCRYLQIQFVPALIAGFMYGFSTAVVAQTLGGHIQLTGIFAFPLIIWGSLRYLDHRDSLLKSCLLLTLFWVLQYGISRELMTCGVILGALLMLIAWIFYPSERQYLGQLVIVHVIAIALAIVLMFPNFWQFAQHYKFSAYPNPLLQFVQLPNLVLPTAITWLNSTWLLSHYPDLLHHTPTFLIENGAYFGIPLLIAFICACWQLRHQHSWIMLFTAFLAPVILALGPFFWWGNHNTGIVLPAYLLFYFNAFRGISPAHFIIFSWLALAIGVGFWLSCKPKQYKWMLITFGILFILPSWNDYYRPWQAPNQTPQFFQSQQYKKLIGKGANLLILDQGELQADALRWQVDSNMYFRLYNGDLGYIPVDYPYQHLAKAMQQGTFDLQSAVQIKQLIQSEGIPYMVITEATYRKYPFIFRHLGGIPEHTQGVWLFHFTPKAWV